MCKILDVFSKDVYVTLELSTEQVGLILDFLGKCTIEYDGEKDKDTKASVEYVTQVFFQKLANAEDCMRNRI